MAVYCVDAGGGYHKAGRCGCSQYSEADGVSNVIFSYEITRILGVGFRCLNQDSRDWGMFQDRTRPGMEFGVAGQGAECGAP